MSSPDTPVPPHSEELRLFRASPAQARMWYAHRADPDNPQYNVFLAARLRGDVAADALAAALRDVVERHEPLRTTFAELDGELHQVVADTVHCELVRTPLHPDELDEHLRGAAVHPFDLAAGPLLRAYLYSTATAEHTLLLVMHHSVVDGWSLEILFRELGLAYQARTSGGTPDWRPLELHYADIVEWELDRFAEGAGDSGLDHWRTALTPPPPPLALPVDRLRSSAPPPDAGRTPLRLTEETSARLRALARSRATTLSTVLLTAYAALLGRWCACPDLIVGTPAAGRSRTETESMVGLFVNTLPVRCRLAGNPTFVAAVDTVRAEALSAFEHQSVPLDAVVSAVRPPRLPGRSPLFDVLFTLQNTGGVTLELPGVEAEWREIPTSWTRFDLEVNFWDEDAVRGILVHRGSLFTERSAREFADALVRLAEAAAADPHTPLSALIPDSALPGRERAVGEAETVAERALLDLPGVAEAVVLPITGPDGADEHTIVAVPEAPLTEERVLATARHAAPTLRLTGVALVSGLPRLPGGRLDTAALSEVAVADAEALRAWNADLARLSPDARARLADAEAAPPEPWHAPDPGRTRIVGGGSTSPAEEPVPAAPSTARLSHSEGGPAPTVEHATLGEALRAAAQGEHGITFVDTRGQRVHLPYRDLYAHARAVLGGLRRHGLREGDRVLLPFRDNQALVPLLWGCLLGGIAAVPWAVPAEWDADAAERIRATWEKLDRPLVATQDDLAGAADGSMFPEGADIRTATELAAEAPVPMAVHAEPDSDALLLLTSGSTGSPKAVRLTHRMVLTRSTAALRVCGVGADDVSLNWMPLDHVGGVAMFHLRDVVAGCAQVQAATPWILADPLRWIDLADELGVTTTWAPNFAFGLVADEVGRRGGDWDLRRLRHILNGGEAVVARTARSFLRALAPHGLPAGAVRPAWGMSETTSGETDNAGFRLDTTADDDAAVEVGRPYPGFALRVVDPTGALVPEGTIGRLQVGGEAVTPGYLNDPERNAEVFTPDGWFDTGDLAVLRDGGLTIAGRAKDVVIVNGVNYTCHDIESAVEDRAPVRRSFTAAVGLPGTDRGERLAILFVPADEVDKGAACTGVREAVRSATGLNPQLLVPVRPEDVPKTGIGKIQRTLLRDRLTAGRFDGAMDRVATHNRDTDTVPGWFDRPVWRQEQRLQHSASVRRVVLVAPDDAPTRALAAALAGDGARVRTVSDAADVPGALADPADRVVIVDDTADTGTGAEEAARQAVSVAVGYRSLLRAIADRHDGSSSMTVTILTRGVLDAPGSAALRVAPQVLPGMVRSAAQELPATTCRLLDTSTATSEAEIAAEVLSGERCPEVALRTGTRWVRRLVPATPEDGWTPRRGDGILVTGGLGGVGVHTAQSLLMGYGARVLLIGRSEPAGEHRAALEDLRQRYGPDRVRYAPCDVTDAAALRAAVESAEQEWGAPLAGAFHLAGDFVEEPITGTRDAEFARLVSVKAVGMGVLADLVDERPGAALVAFSSVNGFLGAPSASAYAAANSFLDGWASAAGARAPGPRRSIGWTMWDETGLSRDYPLKARTHERGSRVLTPEEARRSLGVALRTTAPHVLVGLDLSRPWTRAHAVPGTLPVRAVAVSGAGERGEAAHLLDRHGTPVPLVPDARPTDEDPGPARAYSDLERLVARTWQEVLGVDEVGPDDVFFDLGGASLQMSRVHGLLQMRLEREIDMVDLFRHPSVAAVAAFLDRTAGSEESAAAEDGAAAHGRRRAAARRTRRDRRR